MNKLKIITFIYLVLNTVYLSMPLFIVEVFILDIFFVMLIVPLVLMLIITLFMVLKLKLWYGFTILYLLLLTLFYGFRFVNIVSFIIHDSGIDLVSVTRDGVLTALSVLGLFINIKNRKVQM